MVKAALSDSVKQAVVFVGLGYLPQVWLAPRQLRQLRHLVRHRQQLAQTRRNTKLRVTALLRAERIEFSGSRWTKSWVQAVRTCADLGEQPRLVLFPLRGVRVRRSESRRARS